MMMTYTVCAQVTCSLKVSVQLLKVLLFQVAAVMEGHPASEGQRKRVSANTFAVKVGNGLKTNIQM